MTIDKETMEIIEREIINNIDIEVLQTIGKEKLVIVIKKILDFLGNKKSMIKFIVEELKLSRETNKNGEKILYIRGTICNKDYGTIHYYAFDLEGNYVGTADILSPILGEVKGVELEYWSAAGQENKGNITALAKEVIREIFEGKLYNSMLAKKYNQRIQIDKIRVSINKDNYPSLRVAKKLGFDESGILTIDEYYEQKNNQSKRK